MFPSFVAISRTNDVDALLILLMVLACDAGAARMRTGPLADAPVERRARRAGLQHEDARRLSVVPGIALAFLLCAPGSLRKRLAQLLAAGARDGRRLAAWMRAVELTPASAAPVRRQLDRQHRARPDLQLQRLRPRRRQTGGPGQIPGGTGGVAKRAAPGTERRIGQARSPVHTVKAPSAPPVFLAQRARTQPDRLRRPAGPLRLFGRGLGNQGAWLLPFALVGLLGLALLLLLGERSRPAAELAAGADPRRRPALAADRARRLVRSSRPVC